MNLVADFFISKFFISFVFLDYLEDGELRMNNFFGYFIVEPVK